MGTNREVREEGMGTNREVREVGMGTNREVREVGMGTNREVREVGMGTNREVREVGMGTNREIREEGKGPIKGVTLTVVSNEAIIVDHVVNLLWPYYGRGCQISWSKSKKINCKFYHPNFSPGKPVSVEDIYYALPFHLQ